MSYIHGRALGRQTFLRVVFVLAPLVLFAAVAYAQARKAEPAPEPSWSKELSLHPELFAEFGQLLERLQRDLQLPPARNSSSLLPLLSDNTIFYAGIPNYGDAAQQALTIFRDELQQSAALRRWWQHGDMAVNGRKIEDAIETFYQLSQYLGDEIVVSGAMGGHDPTLLVVAALKKPGFQTALQKTLRDIPAKSQPSIRVLESAELALAQERAPGQELLVLVRPDYVVAALDIATLRSFSTRMDHGSHEFISTPFAQRVKQAYGDGVTMIAASDLQHLLQKAPDKQGLETLQRSGFADVKYLVWERTNVGGQNVSQSELSFVGPRHGIASWLGVPSSLGSLDFASPKAIMIASLVLSNPAQIFDDIRTLATMSNPNAFASITQFEQALNLSIKEDLLRQLSGELTIEIDSAEAPAPLWKAMLRVKDPARLQQTFNTLLTTVPATAQQFEDAGVTYHTLLIPAGKNTTKVGYAFVDGYLIVGSSPQTVVEAVGLHRTGQSLGKSPRFQASLPPGHRSGVSALFYQDPIAMTAIRLQQVAPEIARSLAQLSGQNRPAVMCAYGEETAIRGTSIGASVDVGVVLVAAAIAIPNLLRSRTAANEASAVGTLRMLNSAQATFAASNSKSGFAHDLQALGSNPNEPRQATAEHAALIADFPDCSTGKWCEKSGFRFNLSAVCLHGQCTDYVVTGTPIDAGKGTRNFCSTSDGLIRFKAGPPLTAPLTIAECKAWATVR